MDYDEIRYNSSLKKFLKENIEIGFSEVDYINFLITDLQKFLNSLPEILSDKDLLNKIGSEYSDDQKNMSGYNEYIASLLKIEKQRILRNRQGTINKIEDLEIKKSRLHQPLKKSDKNLLFNGKDLNLSERYKIADKVLNIDKTIRKLNIGDLEKYKLLSYLLNCNKDSARDLMNGKYNSKDRKLTDYFNELGLNE
jgi:hypothetical protein